LDLLFQLRSGRESTVGRSSRSPSPSPSNFVLPPGWVEHYDDDEHQNYYVHQATGAKVQSLNSFLLLEACPKFAIFVGKILKFTDTFLSSISISIFVRSHYFCAYTFGKLTLFLLSSFSFYFE